MSSVCRYTSLFSKRKKEETFPAPIGPLAATVAAVAAVYQPAGGSDGGAPSWLNSGFISIFVTVAVAPSRPFIEPPFARPLIWIFGTLLADALELDGPPDRPLIGGPVGARAWKPYEVAPPPPPPFFLPLTL